MLQKKAKVIFSAKGGIKPFVMSISEGKSNVFKRQIANISRNNSLLDVIYLPSNANAMAELKNNAICQYDKETIMSVCFVSRK